MRIAVLSRNFATTGGGAERYSIALVEELAARHEVHVFAQTIAHDFPGISYHRIPMPLQRPRWINQIYFAWKTWRATRTGFDIVHSHENTWHGNVQTVHVLPIKHNLLVGRAGWRRMLRWMKVMTSPRLLTYLGLEAARYRPRTGLRVVLTSRTLMDVMRVTYPEASPMMHIIAPGVNEIEGRVSPKVQVSARQGLGLPLEGPLFLFVGNDFYKKGLPTLLKAMARLPTQVHLAVVGNSAHMQAMQALSTPLDGRVYFLGSLSEMGEVYRAADVLVHPTQEDTYAMVVLEAMAHGLPVVVSSQKYCGIAAELCDGSEAMLLQDPKDSEELANTLRLILNNPALNQSLSENGWAFAQRQTWASVAKAYERIFKETIPSG
ncbi:glycosyl transferase family 1 [Rhodoferax saidenbachensis]|uniref:Glycosyl transferase family 1 n=1 Tax=Rhodoferax saidenbachensis TaxID=1484693 RepID=A0A1P8KFP8_9BURK|nr:glycosyl transferase family 1 [Rhodoferax saidenbachensis]